MNLQVCINNMISAEISCQPGTEYRTGVLAQCLSIPAISLWDFSDGLLGYLMWSIYSTTKGDGKTGDSRRYQELDIPSDTESSQDSDGGTGPVAVDDSPMAHIHRSLSRKNSYREQETTSTSELKDLVSQLESTRSSSSRVLVALATDAQDLIDHFMPQDVYSTVKLKALGALHDIVKVSTCHTPHLFLLGGLIYESRSARILTGIP